MPSLAAPARKRTHAGSASSASAPDLVQLLDTARAHHLSALGTSCIDELAARLAAAGSSQPAGCTRQQLVEAGAGELVRERLHHVLAGGDWQAPELVEVRDGVPAASGEPCGFTWAVHSFSQRAGEVVSPWVMLAGQQWRLELLVSGHGSGAGTHLSGTSCACLLHLPAHLPVQVPAVLCGLSLPRWPRACKVKVWLTAPV